MAEQTLIHYSSRPELRKPAIVAAFAGWNDAGDAATTAVEALVQAWPVQRFAEIDPEQFYDFTETRPTISLDEGGQRSLEWPTTTLFAHRTPERERDLVLLLGVEPQLKWRTFCHAVLKCAQEVDASSLITLGALLADVPHTVEPHLSGFATVPGLLPKMRSIGVQVSKYEGPTGIIGVLHDAWRSTGLPALSLWGSVPHYISASPNPIVALALLRRVEVLLDTKLPVTALEAQTSVFRSKLDEALAENPEAADYVRQLEEHVAGDSPPAAGPELMDALEEYLRKRRSNGENDTKL